VAFTEASSTSHDHVAGSSTRLNNRSWSTNCTCLSATDKCDSRQCSRLKTKERNVSLPIPFARAFKGDEHARALPARKR
jgi:hypothetical protein